MVILATLAATTVRALRALRSRRVAEIRWHADFEDLPEDCRRCRHAMTGVAPGRLCENAFDCRHCAGHARFAALEKENAGDTFGLTCPANRYYHRGHTWVEPQADGTLLVGLDDLAARLIGDSAEAVLPAPGEPIESNAAAWRIRTQGSEVRFLSPVDGEVVETNNGRGGWFLRLRPTGTVNLRHLLQGSELRAWLQFEIERLQWFLAPPETGPTLADGGDIVDDLPKAQPQANWDSIYGALFLEP